MWSEHGWVRVTAEEAAAKHPGGTVSAHSGLFMCELCGQYVTLTDGYVRDRYFKHSAHEENKNCPERTFGPSYTPSYKAGEHNLPIKLVTDSNTSFRLELGLVCVPETILQKQEKRQVSIIADNGGMFTYSFERLNEGNITYVSVGNSPAETYSLSVSNELSDYWPKKVTGVSKNGSLFDGKTGKMLPVDADVRIEKKYYLLTTRNYNYVSFRRAGLHLSMICQQRVGWPIWNVYQVEARELNETAAKFFLDIHYRLTDSPLELTSIWPMHIESPYVIKANRSELIFHLSGGRQLTTKTFPRARVTPIICPGTGSGQVVKVESNSRQQLISAGNANVLDYLYLWREPLIETYPPVAIVVKDEQGQEIENGIQTTIPQNARLCIEAPVDGTVIILRNEMIIEKLKLNAGEKKYVQDLHFGMTVQVYQGLDNVWSVTYLKLKRGKQNEDENLYLKLCSFKGKETAVDHSIGGLTVKLRDFPMVKKWLLAVIKKGQVPLDAMNYLTKYMASSKKR